MRALSTFQRLSTVLGATSSANFAAALAGAGGCRLRLATGTAAAEQGKPEPTPDAFDQEFDRGEDEVTAAQHEAEYAARVEARRAAGLTVPVDLECEYDRDDPECVDTKELYAERTAAALQDVDLDTEFDRDDPLLADKRALWDVPPPPPEVDLDTEMDRDDPLLADKSHLWDCPEPPCPANIDAELDMMANGEEYLRSQAAGAGQQRKQTA